MGRTITTEELFTDEIQPKKKIFTTEELFGTEQPAKSKEVEKPINREVTKPFTIPSEQSKTVGGFALNIPKSMYQMGKGMVSAIIHPWSTIKGIGLLALGTAQRVMPDNPWFHGSEKYADVLGDMLLDRYGSWENIKNTAYNDPTGLALDVSMGLSGIGYTLKAGGLVKAGKLVSKTGNIINPITIATKITGKGLAKISAPFRKQLNVPATEVAKEVGVKLPASAISNAPSVRIVESLGGKGFFGKKIVDMVDEAGVKLNNIADDIIIKTGKLPDLKIAGDVILAGKDKFRAIWFNVKNKLYNAALIPTSTAGKGIVVTPTKSVEFVNEILNKKTSAQEILGKAKDIGYFKNLGQKLSQTVDGRKLKFAIQELNNRLRNVTDPIVTGNMAELKKLVTLMADDLDDAIKIQRPDLAEKIDRANAYYKMGLNTLNSKWGRKIESLRGQPEKIIPAILNPNTSIEDIPKIIQVIGKENLPQVQSAFLGELFKSAKSPGTGIFYPDGLSQKISKFGDSKLQTLLTPSQYKTVKNIEILAQALGKGQKVATGSQTAYIGRIGMELSTIFYNPLLALKFMVGDALFSGFVSSSLGQKYLTEGFVIGRVPAEKLIKFSPTIGKIGFGLYQIEKLK